MGDLKKKKKRSNNKTVDNAVTKEYVDESVEESKTKEKHKKRSPSDRLENIDDFDSNELVIDSHCVSLKRKKKKKHSHLVNDSDHSTNTKEDRSKQKHAKETIKDNIGSPTNLEMERQKEEEFSFSPKREKKKKKHNLDDRCEDSFTSVDDDSDIHTQTGVSSRQVHSSNDTKEISLSPKKKKKKHNDRCEDSLAVDDSDIHTQTGVSSRQVHSSNNTKEISLSPMKKKHNLDGKSEDSLAVDNSDNHTQTAESSRQVHSSNNTKEISLSPKKKKKKKHNLDDRCEDSFTSIDDSANHNQTGESSRQVHSSNDTKEISLSPKKKKKKHNLDERCEDSFTSFDDSDNHNQTGESSRQVHSSNNTIQREVKEEMSLSSKKKKRKKKHSLDKDDRQEDSLNPVDDPNIHTLSDEGHSKEIFTDSSDKTLPRKKRKKRKDVEDISLSQKKRTKFKKVSDNEQTNNHSSIGNSTDNFTGYAKLSLDLFLEKGFETFPSAKLHDFGMTPTSREQVNKLRAMGMKVMKGMWKKWEDEILKINMSNFCQEVEVYDCDKLIFPKLYEEEGNYSHLTREKEMYHKLGNGIDRPLLNVYYRCRKIFDKNNYKGRYTSEEVKAVARLHAKYGSKWTKIGRLIDRAENSVINCFRFGIAANKTLGVWTKNECRQLTEAVLELVSGDLGSEAWYYNIPWEKVQKKVPTREAKQCRHQWLAILSGLTHGETILEKDPWTKTDDVKLIERISKTQQ
ncbi:uncharacterized protein [Antedon mediterranea]|uniref:uncharacterized protein isoform X2 n=1 Tax=Antedon mediterranea TaxID=105859 RepID=UPI003AF9CD6F